MAAKLSVTRQRVAFVFRCLAHATLPLFGAMVSILVSVVAGIVLPRLVGGMLSLEPPAAQTTTSLPETDNGIRDAMSAARGSAAGGTVLTSMVTWADRAITVRLLDGLAEGSSMDPLARRLVTYLWIAVVLFAFYHTSSMLGHWLATVTAHRSAAACVRIAATALMATPKDDMIVARTNSGSETGGDENASAAAPAASSPLLGPAAVLSSTSGPQMAAEVMESHRGMLAIVDGLITNLVIDLVSSLGYLAAVVSIDPRPAAFVAIVVLTGRGATEAWRRLGWIAAVDGAELGVSRGRVGALVAKAWQRWETIHIWNLRPYMETRIASSLDADMTLNARFNIALHGNTAVSSFVTNCLYATMLAAVGYYRAKGALPQVDLVLLMLYMKNFMDRSVGLVHAVVHITSHLPLLDPVVSRVSHEGKIGAGRSHPLSNCPRAMGILREPPAADRAVVLRHVSVRLNGRPRADGASGGSIRERPLLDDVNVTVASGSLVMLIGRSGAGKSTLLRVIAGLVAPTTGDVEIRCRTSNTSRQRVEAFNPVLVEQLPALVPFSVRDNLTLGRQGLDDIHLHRALDHVNMWDAVLDAGGLDARVDIDGGSCPFSVGQLQRLCLARVFLHDAPVLLFDEPTSGADPVTSSIVARAIWTLVGDHDGVTRPTASRRTVVLSTHSGASWLLACGVNAAAAESRIVVVALADGRVGFVGSLSEGRRHAQWGDYLS